MRAVQIALVMGLVCFLLLCRSANEEGARKGPEPLDEVDRIVRPTRDVLPTVRTTPKTERDMVRGMVWRAGGPAEARVRMVWIDPDLSEDEVQALLASKRAWSVAADVEQGFEVPRPGAHGLAMVPVDSRGRWGSTSIIAPDTLDRTRAVSLHLWDGPHRLEIQIQGPDGRPVSGRVRLESRVGGFTDTQSTDDNGRVIVQGLYPDQVRVHIRAWNMAWTVPNVALPRQAPLSVVLPTVDRTRRVTVSEAPTGASVNLGHVDVFGVAQGGVLWESSEVVQDGEVWIPIVGAVRGLRARCEGWTTGGVLVDPAPADSLLAVGRVAALGVLVRDSEDVPMRGVRVNATGVFDGHLVPDRHVRSATTSLRGRAVISALGSESIVPWVLSDGWASMNVGRLEQGRVPGAAVLSEGVTRELVVVPAARLDGRITDPDGAALSNALVLCDLHPRRWAHPWKVGRVDRPSPVAQWAWTDEHGRFRVPALTPDAVWHVHVSHPRFEFPDNVSKPIGARGEYASLTVVLSPAERQTLDFQAVRGHPEAGTRALVVHVEDPRGSPVPYARVTWSSREPWVHSEWAIADESGRLVVPSPPRGALRVHASAPGWLKEGIVVPAGAATCTVRVREGDEARFRIRLPDGSPVVRPHTTFYRGRFPAFDRQMIVAQGGPGQLVVRALDPLLTQVEFLAYERQVSWQARVPIGLTVPVGGVLPVTLRSVDQPFHGNRQADQEKIRVVGTHGEPLGSVRVHVSHPAVVQYATSQGDVLPQGQGPRRSSDKAHWVEITRPTWPGGVPAPFGQLRLGPFTAGNGMAAGEIRLPPEQVVRGRVTDTVGSPVEGVWITASAVPPDHMAKFSTVRTSSAFTDALGRFALRNLSHMEIDLRIPAGASHQEVRMRVRPPQADLQVRLRDWARADLTVVDPSGQAIEGALVSIEDPELSLFRNRDRWRRTDAKGVARVRRLATDRAFRLDVSPPASRPSLLPVRRERWRPEDGTVILPESVSVQGAVVDAAGRPLASVRVIARETDEDGARTLGNAVSQSAGMFLIEGLPPGPVVLMAQTGLRQEVIRSGPLNVNLPRAADIQIVLPSQRSIVVDVSSLGLDREVTLLLAEVDEEGQSTGRMDAQRTTQPRIVWHGLRPGARYIAWGVAAQRDEARAGVARIDSEASSAALDAAGSNVVHLRVPGLTGKHRFTVRLAFPDLPTRYERDGEIVMVPLPPGTWTLRVMADVDGHRIRETLEAAPGDRIDIPRLSPVEEDDR